MRSSTANHSLRMRTWLLIAAAAASLFVLSLGIASRASAYFLVLAGDDLYQTVPGSSSIDLSKFGIGEDAFGPGSLQLSGVPVLTGDAFSPGTLGQTDTIIRRTADADIPDGGSAVVPVEIVSLNLVSVDPILIIFEDGHSEDWDLRIEPSQTVPSTGTADIFGDSAGGFFTVSMDIHLRLIFTRVSDGEQRDFDTGSGSASPIMAEGSSSWMADCPIAKQAPGQETNFYPGCQPAFNQIFPYTIGDFANPEGVTLVWQMKRTQGSCLAAGSCTGNVTVGTDACNGDNSCQANSGVMVVGDNSCNGDDACQIFTTLAATLEVADDSCNGEGSCVGFDSAYGDGSCNGDNSCNGVGNTVGSGSCNIADVCNGNGLAFPDGDADGDGVPDEAPAGSITIVKDARPEGPQDFSFDGDLGHFSLDDDEDPALPHQRTFTELAPGEYTVTEGDLSGWLLFSVFCLDPTSDSSGDVSSRSATINLAAGEHVTCIFLNYGSTDVELLGKQVTLSPSTPVLGEARYTIYVRNNGPAPAADVVIWDELAPGLTVLDVQYIRSPDFPEDDVFPEPCTLPCRIGQLLPGQEARLLIDVLAEPGEFINPGFVVNEGRVSAANDSTPDNNVGHATLTTDGVVTAGGPYTVDEGGSIELNGTCGSCTDFSWDLDGDGQFDDATGNSPVFDATDQPPGEYPIGLLACTDPGEFSGVCGSDFTTISVVPVLADVEMVSKLVFPHPEVVSEDPRPMAEGDTATYSIRVVNNGPAAASDVVIEDVVPTSLTVLEVTYFIDGDDTAMRPCSLPCVVPDLPAGEHMTLVVEVRADQAGVFGNIARVFASNDSTPDNNTQSATLTVANVPPTLAQPPDVTVDAGEPFTYTFTFSGHSNDTFTVRVDWDDGSPLFVLTLPAPGDVDVTHTYDATVERTVEPTVRVEDDDGAFDEETFLVTVLKPDLIAVKSNDEGGEVVLGESWAWTVHVENVGETDAGFATGSVILLDTLPPGADYGTARIVDISGVSGDISCGITGTPEAGQTLQCDAASNVTFAPGGYFDVRFLATPASRGTFVNPAAATGAPVCMVDPGNVVAESDEENNGCGDTVTVRAPDLIAQKSNDVGGFAVLGGSWTWTITVRNIGDGDATFTGGDPAIGFLGDPILSDLLPFEDITYSAPGVSAAGVTNGGGIVCDIVSFILNCYGQAGDVTIHPGGVVTATFAATPSNPGDYLNPWNLVDCGADPLDVVVETFEANNSCFDAMLVGAPDLTAEKSNDVGGETLEGGSFTWTIAVRNDGNAAAVFEDGEVMLQDDLTAGAAYGAPVASGFTNVAGIENIACEIVALTLTCHAEGGDVTLGEGAGGASSFGVTFSVTPAGPGVLDNPSGGICRVDPATPLPGNVAEAVESNNDCSDSVTVTPAGGDSDGDGLSDAFEDSFGGGGVTISGADSVSATGDAASGAAITAGNFTVEFPAGTTTDTVLGIIISIDPPAVAISGASLSAGTTKAVLLPIGGQTAVCIDDSPGAAIDAVTTGACESPRVEIAVPASIGDSNSSGQYAVTRVSSVHVRVEGLLHTAIALIEDDDLDGVHDADDVCRSTPGRVDYQGCDLGIAADVILHVVDQAKRGDCGGVGSCKLPVDAAHVRVFDRNDPDFQAAYGMKNPGGGVYDQVFENGTGQAGSCTTGADGLCVAGLGAKGDYLVIVKFHDAETGKTVYTGKPIGPEDFVDSDSDGQGDLGTKEFQVIKVVRKDGTVQLQGGSKTVLTGSYLEIISPEYAVWDEGAEQYVYPFIFSSDSDWQVDVCTQVPEGYAVVGVYDAEGNLVTTSECVQTVVANETRVVAFEVVDLQSPPPHVMATFKIRHKGRLHQFDLETPGHRVGRDRPEGRETGQTARHAAPAGIGSLSPSKADLSPAGKDEPASGKDPVDNEQHPAWTGRRFLAQSILARGARPRTPFSRRTGTHRFFLAPRPRFHREL